MKRTGDGVLGGLLALLGLTLALAAAAPVFRWMEGAGGQDKFESRPYRGWRWHSPPQRRSAEARCEAAAKASTQLGRRRASRWPAP